VQYFLTLMEISLNDLNGKKQFISRKQFIDIFAMSNDDKTYNIAI
jgi:hypothetical protein